MTFPPIPETPNPNEKPQPNGDPYIPEGDFSNLPAFVEDTRIPEPPQYSHTTPIRRRRRPRSILQIPADDAERAELHENISRRAAPTFDFFLFSLLSGAIIGLGYLLNAQAVLIFGVLIAPLMAPWLGIGIAALTASNRFFTHALGGFFIGTFFVFLTGILAGFASRLFTPPSLTQAILHSRLWIPELILVVIAATLLVLTFSRTEDKLILPSIMLVYSLYLPAGAAGFGLGNGTPGIWPNALFIFGIHFALATIVGILAFYYMGFRPTPQKGYAFPVITVAFMVFLILGINGLAATILPAPAPVAQSTPSATDAPALATPIPASPTPQPSPTATLTATATLTPTPDYTETPTPVPTPVYGRINSPAGGAALRQTPGGSLVVNMLNDILVEIYPERIQHNGQTWAFVKATVSGREYEGWMVIDNIRIPTPAAP
jgi:uncharacterized membrane protein